MDKKYLMKSMAALMLVASVSSCVNDDIDSMDQAELNAAIKENAELQLGITIPEGQTWEMSTQVTTDIAINLGLDQSYTVGIYDVDPRFSKNSTFYTLEKVDEGGRLNTSITLPNAMSTAYVAVYDSKLNLQTVKVVSIENDAIIANVGGTAANRAMRGVFTDDWSKRHDCKVSDESVFEFTQPSNAVDITKGSFTDAEKKATVYYIPSSFSGDFNFNYAFNIPAGSKIYNYGTVTSLNGINYDGVITFYNAGTLTFTGANGGRHTVINSGALTVCDYANIGDLYNGGALVLERGHNPYWANEGGSADIPNDMHIYSNGSATIEMPDGGDLKAVCDIHGTLKVGDGKYLKIQNSTLKYICGIESTNTVENTDGPLETSYIKAKEIKFDGNPIYLLPQAYITATTIKIPNSNCHVYAYENSYALVEATNFEFGNKNDFTHTFTNSIKFKVSGYVKVDNCYAMGQSHYFNNVNDYLADTTHSDEFALAKDRINLDNVYGTSECGGNYGNIPEGNTGIKGNPIVYTYAFEDQKVSGDYDMNDIVLKVSHPYTVNSDGGYDYDTNKLKCELVAAGATFNIKVFIGNNTEALFERKEVHQALGVGEGVMVNTGTHTGVQNGVKPAECTVNAPIGWDGDFSNLDVKIYVMLTINEPYYIEYKKENEWPYAVMIPMDWQWPTERTRVTQAYSNFATWASTPSAERTAAMNEWYKTPVSGKVMSNQ